MVPIIIIKIENIIANLKILRILGVGKAIWGKTFRVYKFRTTSIMHHNDAYCAKSTLLTEGQQVKMC